MRILITIIFLISVLAKGSFFGTTYIFLGLLVLISLIFTFQKIPPLKITILLLILCGVYLISALFNHFSLENLIYAVRPLVCLLFFLLVFNVEDKQYLGRVVILGGVTTAVIGLIVFSGLFNFEGMITANRLQSTFQYANATGIFFAACALLTRSKEYTDYKSTIIILETALFLTQSVGAVVTYLFCLSLCLILQTKQLRITVFSETIVRLFVSSLLAVLLYSSVYILHSLVLSAIMLGVLLLSFKYGQTQINKLVSTTASLVSVMGISVLILLFYSLRGEGSFYTYIERLIQISDGVKVIIQQPFFGAGPGVWQNIKYAYQTANYQTGYLHSSLVQIGLDAGIMAVIIFIALMVLIVRRFDRNNLFKHMALYSILLHSLFDITLNFMAINFLLCILISLIYTESEHIISNYNRNWRWLFLIPSLLFMYMFVIQVWFNNTYMNIQSAGLEKSIHSFEKIRNYHYRSYQVNVMLAELYYQNNEYNKFINQVGNIPYKTAEVFYLESKMELGEKNYKKAIEKAFKCIEFSMYQEDGYNLALEIMGHFSKSEQIYYQGKLDEYNNLAQKRMHPWAHLIPP